MDKKTNFELYIQYLTGLLAEQLVKHDRVYVDELLSKLDLKLPNPVTRPALLCVQKQLCEIAEKFSWQHVVKFPEVTFKIDHDDILMELQGKTIKVGRTDLSGIDEQIAIASHSNNTFGITYERIKYEDPLGNEAKTLRSVYMKLKKGLTDDEKVQLCWMNNWQSFPRKVKLLRPATYYQDFFIAQLRNWPDKVQLISEDELIFIDSTSEQYKSSLMAEALANDISDALSIY